MLQAFIQNVSSLFQTYVCKCFDLDVVYVSHMLQEYVPNVQFYIAASVFMLQVVSIYLEVAYIAMAIHVCCKYMFQMF
jgi:hypothetical protein